MRRQPRTIGGRESDRRQQASEQGCGRFRTRPRRAARCTSRRTRRRSFLRPRGTAGRAVARRVRGASDAQQGMTEPAACGPTAWPNTCSSGCAASCESSSRCSRDQAALACTTQLCGLPQSPGLACVAAGPDERTLRPAAHVRAEVERRVERESGLPSRAHAHFGEVAKSAAMRAEQRRGLGCRDGHGDRIEDDRSGGRHRSAVPIRAGRGAFRAP